MKTMLMTNRRVFSVVASLTLFSTAIAMLTGCPQGAKTTVTAGVTATVDPAQCAEVRPTGGALSGDTVTLDCANLTGSGTIRIEFPRKAWWDAKLSRSSVDAGPGK